MEKYKFIEDISDTMAALSAIKNKKTAKMREAIDNLAVRCGANGPGEGVSVSLSNIHQVIVKLIIYLLNTRCGSREGTDSLSRLEFWLQPSTRNCVLDI